MNYPTEIYMMLLVCYARTMASKLETQQRQLEYQQQVIESLMSRPVQQVNVYHIHGGQFVAGNNTGSIIHAEGSQVMGHGNSACVQADRSNVNIVGSNSNNNVSNQDGTQSIGSNRR